MSLSTLLKFNCRVGTEQKYHLPPFLEQKAQWVKITYTSLAVVKTTLRMFKKPAEEYK